MVPAHSRRGTHTPIRARAAAAAAASSSSRGTHTPIRARAAAAASASSSSRGTHTPIRARAAAAASASSPHTTHHTPHTTHRAPCTTRLRRPTTPATSRHGLAFTPTPANVANTHAHVVLPGTGSYRAGICSGTSNGYSCKECDNAVCRGENTYRTGAWSPCSSR